MNVIKESHESILRRKNLDQEKRRILSMDFKKKSDKADWERLNKFLYERQSQITTASNEGPGGAGGARAEGRTAVTEGGDQSFQLPTDNEATQQVQWELN